MQSIEFKRFPIYRLAIAVAAVGTLAIILIATGTLFDETGERGSRALGEVRTTQRTAPAYSDDFLEWNTNLPAISAEPIQRVEDIRFIEMNTMLPGRTHPTVRSYAEAQFLEMNTFLPGITTTTVQSYDNMRFLEMNVLPGDDAPYLPRPDESQPTGALTEY